MTTTSQYTDGASTAGLLSYPGAMSFVNGNVIADPSNQTSSSTISASAATEVEYNFKITSAATASNYCFRVADKSAANSNTDKDLDNYSHVAEVSVSYPPTISNFNWPLSFITNGIILTEGTTTTVSATGTVTDYNGYADIVSATSSINRSGATSSSSCTANDNNCYKVPSCTFSNCAGTSCTLTCSANLQYFADPTDASSTMSAENWLASLRIQDSTGLSATSSTSGADVRTLYGLTVDTSINYDGGTAGLAPGSDTGSRLATTTVTNTGNSPIDIRLSGDNVGSIPVNSQKYSTSTFTYASCSVCALLSGPATPAYTGLSIPKVTASSTPTTSKVYWGISIPIPTAAGVQSGTNYFEAAAPLP